jgi:hypothetical protein
MPKDIWISYPDAKKQIMEELPLSESQLRRALTDDPDDNNPNKLHCRRTGKGAISFIRKSEIVRFVKAFKG